MDRLKLLEKIYKDAQNSSNLKANDYVKILDINPEQFSFPVCWFSERKKIKEIINMTGKIYDICPTSVIVKVDGLTYFLPYFILEKVENQKPQFKPFDRVLVRDSDDGIWEPDIFRWYGIKEGLFEDPSLPFQCMSDCWRQCIPYEGNENLVGTTNND